jgi:hypothetical protein
MLRGGWFPKATASSHGKLMIQCRGCSQLPHGAAGCSQLSSVKTHVSTYPERKNPCR